jgi:hypothetical protein
MKIWPWKSNISGSLTTFMYPLEISAERVVTKNVLKYLERTGLTKTSLIRVGQKAVLLQTCHIVSKLPRYAP